MNFSITTSRCTQDDIHVALNFVANVLDKPYSLLMGSLLGTSELVAHGLKKDCGDVDIALVDNPAKWVETPVSFFNAGPQIGTYWIPIASRMIKTDVMYVPNLEWAKWIYHSEEGVQSKYKGGVRNIILFTALAYTQEPGKDFVLRDEWGHPFARASRSVRMNVGMERQFKLARYNTRYKRYNKLLGRVSPEQLEAFLESIGEKISFSHDSDLTTKPDDVARFIFGPTVKAQDLLTAEDVIAHIHRLSNADEIVKACRIELARSGFTTPDSL